MGLTYKLGCISQSTILNVWVHKLALRKLNKCHSFSLHLIILSRYVCWRAVGRSQNVHLTNILNLILNSKSNKKQRSNLCGVTGKCEIRQTHCLLNLYILFIFVHLMNQDYEYLADLHNRKKSLTSIVTVRPMETSFYGFSPNYPFLMYIRKKLRKPYNWK